MTEKIMLGFVFLCFGGLGWFLKDLITEVKETQRKHNMMLIDLRQHIQNIETGQSTFSMSLEKLQNIVIAASGKQNEMKSILDRNLYEMRQQLKEQSDDMHLQKQNFGKVMVIVQKLFLASKNGSSK